MRATHVIGRAAIFTTCVVWAGLGLSGCAKPEAQGDPASGVAEASGTTRASTRASARASTTITIAVSMPGHTAMEVEAELLGPIEAALRDVAGLRHISSEAREGQARLALSFASDTDLDQVAVDLRSRLAEVAPKLPADAEAPVLVRSDPSWGQLRWFIHSQELDPATLAQLHARLLARGETIAGVRTLATCAPRPRVVIELDRPRLAGWGRTATEVEAAVRLGLADQPGFTAAGPSIAGLRAIELASGDGTSTVTLGDLAAIRFGLGDPECMAATAGGIAASATLELAGPEALTAVRSMLEAATLELPDAVQLGRFDPQDTIIELSLPTGTDLRTGAELIGRGFSRETPNWLVEVGVGELERADPSTICAGLGLRVHLSVPGSPKSNAGLIHSLRAVPGVIDVAALDVGADRRLWLLGPDLDDLARRAQVLRTSYADLDVLADGPHPQVDVRVDAAALAKFGVSAQDLAHELALARGVEVGSLLDGEGTPVPIILRSAGPDEADPDSLEGLVMQVGGEAVPLTALASVERHAAPSRICHFDGQRGIQIRVPDPLGAKIEAALPGQAWAWADGDAEEGTR